MASYLSVPSSWSSQGGSRQAWMGRGTCSMNLGPSPPLSMETSAAKRSQKLTALGVRRPWIHMVSRRRENQVAGGEGLGAGPESSRGKASLLNSSGYRQLANWLLLPGPQVCLRLRLPWGGQQRLLYLWPSRIGLEGGGENTPASPPPILTQPSSHLLGYIGLISSDLKNMDTSWLDSLLPPVRLPSIQAIPCAP